MEEISIPLIHSIKNRLCVPFFGAGLSVEAGLPDAASLADSLKKDIGLSGSSILTLSKIAQIYENKFGRIALEKRLELILKHSKIKPSNSHFLLAKLCQAGFVESVVTPNFDELFELSLPASTDCRPIIHDSTLPYHDNEKPEIVKYHGTISKPNSLVITENDYMSFLRKQPGIVAMLQTILLKKTIIFIGFSMEDFDFKLFYDILRPNPLKCGRQSYLVLPKPQSFSTSDWLIYKQFYLYPKNIRVIESTANEFLVNLTTKLLLPLDKSYLG